MSESRTDGDRVVLATTIILAVVSVVMYFIVYLTLFQFQMLNDMGRAFSIVAMVIGGLVMLLACYLALTNRGRSLASPGLSGSASAHHSMFTRLLVRRVGERWDSKFVRPPARRITSDRRGLLSFLLL